MTSKAIKNYVQIKPDQYNELSFVTHSVMKDGSVKTMEIEVGGKAYLLSAGWDCLYVSLPEPDKYETRYQVSGTVRNAEIKEKTFSDEYSAKSFVETLGSDEVKIAKVEWNITQNKIANPPTPQKQTTDEEIPF